MEYPLRPVADSNFFSFRQDTERAIRLRDNKRRHRQRQREYVTDLEQKLAESRAAGIQATKEVQAAARQVVWENSRLRQILRDQGLSNDVIESLIYKDGGPYVLGDKPCLLWGGAAQTQLLASHHVRREPARLVGWLFYHVYKQSRGIC